MTKTSLNEQKFYKALQDVFIGSRISGEGGFINLLHIKERYYKKVLEEFKNQVRADPAVADDFKEDFFGLLYTFFQRYFSECGSVYFVQSASWQKIYEKVYTDNKDVVLFWKTNMLYYVKSDILFNNVYVVSNKPNTDEEYVFYFDVDNLVNKQNNTKKPLVFTYQETRKGKEKGIHTANAGDLTFVFAVAYKEGNGKNDIADEARKAKVDAAVLEQAIRQFKRQSTADFFINKNAEKFLTEQLDLFLHQYLLEDKNVFDQERLNQIKAVKCHAQNLIAFIGQFENELVLVWNKPKFVLNSNYVITIDKLPAEIIGKLAKHKGMIDQVTEWVSLAIVDDGFVFVPDRLAATPHLPIDTKYFKDMEIEILSLFDNLDDALDGRLIHSENYQALNTLQTRYRGQVQCIYIDPPFNTGNDFEYIDGYQDSTWLSILYDRLLVSSTFLGKSGNIFTHLDRYANYYGRELLNNIFGADNYKAEIYWDTCGNTGFKTSKNNWYQNTNCIIHYAKNSSENKFNKIYTLLNVEDQKIAKNERKDKKIGWLDILRDEQKKTYVEQYVGDKLINNYHTFNCKVDPVGMIWTDVLSFLYTQVGNNESYFFNGGQKPEHLLARIIQSSTQQNEIVLDYFSGIGTTCAVAKKLNRKFIGIEMGDHFETLYLSPDDSDGFVCKVGIIGRMKNVLNGDWNFKVQHPEEKTLSSRAPQLTRQLNWQGGGFFKYYDLEQYEDTLARMVYSKEKGEAYAEDIFRQYVFFADEKLADIFKIAGDDIDLDFSKLFKGKTVDLAETVSLLYGKPILRITSDEVVLQDIENPIKINTKKMTNEEKIEFAKTLKTLLWWGE